MVDYLNYATRTAITTATVASDVTAIQTAGYATEGDGGAALYKRIATPEDPNTPQTSWRFKSANAPAAAWWELAESAPVIQQFGGFADNDIRNALNDAFAYCDSKRIGKLRIPAGGYNVNSRPNEITSATGLVIEGEGRQSTILYRNYSESNGVAQGMLTFKCQPLGVRHLSIIGATETTGGSYISVQSTASIVAGYADFTDLNLTTGTAVEADIYISGAANSGGVRSINMIGNTFFGAEDHSLALASIKGMNFSSGISQAGGSRGELYVTGTMDVPSTNCNFVGPGVNKVSIDHTDQFIFMMPEVETDLTIGSTARNGAAMVGHVGGTITNNSTSVRVVNWGTGDVYGTMRFNNYLTVTDGTRTAFLNPGFAGGAGFALQVNNNPLILSTNDTARWQVERTGSFVPSYDNAHALGNGSFRPSVIYAVSGTINTSGVSEKTLRGEPEEAVFDAVLSVPLQLFQWNDAIAQKGSDNARFHYGPSAEDVRDAFVERGLDPTRYALFCVDEICERVVKLRKTTRDGKDVEVASEEHRPTGRKRLGLRLDQFDRLRTEALRRKLLRSE